MKESFVDIQGYCGLYMIGNMGSVYSLVSNKTLKPSIGRTGYYRIVLYKNKTGKTYNVHRLVAQGFLGLDVGNKKIVVMHIDDNGLNNVTTNLRLGTHQDNMVDAKNKGRICNYNGGRPFTDETIMYIRNSKKRKFELAKELGVNWSVIHYIVKGKTYKNARKASTRVYSKNELIKMDETKKRYSNVRNVKYSG